MSLNLHLKKLISRDNPLLYMNKGEKFFIDNGQIFSNKANEVVVPKFQSLNLDLKIDSKKIHQSNKEIILKLEDNLKKDLDKSLKISGEITNFKETKDKIEEDFQKFKSKFSEPKEEDYEFQEKVSQIEITEQMISMLKKIDNSELELQLKSYLNNIKDIEDLRIKEVEDEIEKHSKAHTQIKKKKDEFKTNEVEKTTKEIELKLKEKEKFEIEIENLEEKIEKSNSEVDDAEIKNIKKQILLDEEKIEKINTDIEIKKLRIENLKREAKLGKRKKVNLVFFILTLGLIYWTKYSDLSYHLIKEQNSINNKKEKILHHKNKINSVKNKLKEQFDNAEEQKKKNANQVKLAIKRLEDLREKLERHEKDMVKIEEDLEKKQENLNLIEKEVEESNSKLENFNILKSHYKEFSSKRIEQLIEEIEKVKRMEIEKLNKIKEKLQNQKINIKGSWIYTS